MSNINTDEPTFFDRAMDSYRDLSNGMVNTVKNFTDRVGLTAEQVPDDIPSYDVRGDDSGYKTEAAQDIDRFIEDLADADSLSDVDLVMDQYRVPQEYAEKMKMALRTGLADGDLSQEEVATTLALLGEGELNGIDNPDAIQDAQLLGEKYGLSPEFTAGLAEVIEISEDLRNEGPGIENTPAPQGDLAPGIPEKKIPDIPPIQPDPDIMNI